MTSTGRTGPDAADDEEPCPAYVTLESGHRIRCTKPVGHGPTEDIHHGLLPVTLPTGDQTTAFLVWSTAPIPWDDGNARRSR